MSSERVGWTLVALLVSHSALATERDAGSLPSADRGGVVEAQRMREPALRDSAAESNEPLRQADPRVARIQALLEGRLDASVSPESLFDVVVTDDAAVELEAARLRTLLSAAEARAPREPAVGAPPRGDAWELRLELDRARLSFYALDSKERARLLSVHAARQAAEQATTDPEADLERLRALEAAKAARAEAERAVHGELERLTAVERDIHTLQQRFSGFRAELTVRRDLLLGWQRRVRDAKGADDLGADATYDGLSRQLHASRAELRVALDALNAPSEVPGAGADLLGQLPSDISTDAVHSRRLAVERASLEARREESAIREERAAVLLDELTTLNRERLALFAHLTDEKRLAVSGFTLAGWDQALAEIEHVRLIFGYHRHVAWQWVNTVRRGDAGASVPWRLLTFGVPLLGAVVVFLWARRRLQALAKAAETRVLATERVRHVTSSGPARHLLRLWLKTHGPLEWLAFCWVVFELLPGEALELVEVQVVRSVITWSLVGALVVNATNALASGRNDFAAAVDEDAVGQLRLRSLRLVGGTVVAFGLTLVLCERLVGMGTIYRWVSSSSIVAVLLVFLTLVRWWRGTVFERLDKVRKKTPLQAWLLANQSGWPSFLAAMVGALQLFVHGTFRVARSWVSGFDLARRVHAYLFKREIERLGEGAVCDLSPLPARALDVLHPEAEYDQWIPCPSDLLLDAVRMRCTTDAGGIVAVHGARGMGKTSLLRALQRYEGAATTLITCHHETTLSALQEAFAPGSGQAGSVTGSRRLVLLDDCQRLIDACIGGLSRFDEIIAWMRGTGSATTWVLTFDSTMWPLLQRARDSRPIFDEASALAPWTETQIGALLLARSNRAELFPTYADLLDKLPPGADEVERQEALDAKRAGYQRMLWDHVGGNPGLALEAWRASLARDAAGNVRVRPLQVPDVTPLEHLPDTSLFVMRAVLQLAPTTVDAVARATRLRPDEVLVDFRFGKTRGYFEEREGRVRVTWPWLCAVVQLLSRRRLLGAS